MPTFNSGGVTIAYETAGEGPPILLIHGFASTGRVNWWDTGWVKLLVDSGRMAVTFGHRLIHHRRERPGCHAFQPKTKGEVRLDQRTITAKSTFPASNKQE